MINIVTAPLIATKDVCIILHQEPNFVTFNENKKMFKENSSDTKMHFKIYVHIFALRSCERQACFVSSFLEITIFSSSQTIHSINQRDSVKHYDGARFQPSLPLPLQDQPEPHLSVTTKRKGPKIDADPRASPVYFTAIGAAGRSAHISYHLSNHTYIYWRRSHRDLSQN